MADKQWVVKEITYPGQNGYGSLEEEQFDATTTPMAVEQPITTPGQTWAPIVGEAWQWGQQGGGTGGTFTNPPTPTKKVSNPGSPVAIQPNNQPIQKQDNFEIDPNRQLNPMTDPIAYRKDYNEGDIIKQPDGTLWANNKVPAPQNEQVATKQNQWGSNEFWDRLDEENWGVIHGRASGDRNSKINTIADPYSVEEAELRQRQNRYNSLKAMDSYDIALALASGYSLYGETAMRDLMSYDPVKYEEVKRWEKRIQTGDTVNSIAQWKHGSATEQVTKSTDVVNDSINAWTNNNSNERTHNQVQELLTGKLTNNQTATTATQEMLNLKEEIAELEEKMANLPKEAQKAFKGDVPQYIIDAFVSNNAQRYQSEINKLQSRYNSALDLYKTELSHAERESEMELKVAEYNFKINQQNWDNAFKTSQQNWENAFKINSELWNQQFKTRQQDRTEKYQSDSLLMNNVKTDKKWMPYIVNPDGTYTYLTNSTESKLLESYVQNAVDTLNAVYQDGMDGGQCEEFTDSFNNSVYGQTMLPVDEDWNVIQGRTWTYGSEKVQYVNSANPKIGTTAIFKYPYTAIVSNDAKVYGHTMMVTDYDPLTKTLTLKGSNRTGDQKVYTTTMTLEEFYGKKYGAGFWDPSQPTWFQEAQQGDVVETTGYAKALTPMTQSINTLKENAWTSSEREVIATAEMMYDIMYELNTEGAQWVDWFTTYTDALIKSGVVEDFLNSLDRKKFWNKDDERWSAFLEQLGKFIRNNVKDETIAYAMNRLYQMVEQKLRKESGAAINSSERAMDFQLFLPMIWESEDLRRKKLEAWDDIIYRDFSSAWLTQDQYIPLFQAQKSSPQRTIFGG